MTHRSLAGALLAGAALAPFGFTPNAAAQDAGGVTADEVITVTGRAAEFYRAETTSFGSKIPASVFEIPQSVQVITRQLIDDQAAREITDLYRNISGVSVFSYSGVTFRGFRQDEIRYDGLLGDPFSGFSVPLLFDVERVEVLKGPAGALYGGGEPGGLINYATKGPEFEPSTALTLSAGNFDLFGVRGEATGEIANGLAARVGGAYETISTFRNNTEREDAILAADAAWRLSEDATLTVKLDYVDQDYQGARLRGVPVDDEGNFLTDIDFNTNETSNFQRLETFAATAELDWSLSAATTLRVAARYVDLSTEQEYLEPRGLFVRGGETLMRREFRDQSRERQEISGLIDLTHEFSTGALDHTLLVGAEAFRSENEDFFQTAVDELTAAGAGLPAPFAVPSLNVQNPDYGNFDADAIAFTRIDDREGETTETALYAQDQIAWKDWILSIGGRYERFEDDSEERRTIPPLGSSSLSEAAFEDEAFSARLGLIRKLSERASLYAVYSEGFSPQSTSNQDPGAGGPFDPETGTLYEAGVKSDIFGGRVLAQAAIYQIDKENVLVADPTPGAPTGALSEIGEVRSRGFELDLVGDVTENWTFTASYAFNETKIEVGADEIRNAVGDEFANAPDHQFGLWTRYDIAPLNSAISGGVEYVGERVSLSGQEVQAYTTVDVGWVTAWDRYSVQLNVRNLFDEEYAESGFIARTGHFPGEPRTATVELTASF